MSMRRNSAPHRQQSQNFWRRVVVRKLFNISDKGSDFSADTDSDSGSDSDQEIANVPKESRLKKVSEDPVDEIPPFRARPRIRRRNSETLRAQYINTKEIRVCAATWNVAGKFPPDDLDIDGWLDIKKPADIYVIGLQEIIPLSAGNIFGSEDNRPVSKWENIIRETLSKIPPVNKYKCYSDPPSPSRFKPLDDAPDIEDEILLESDSEDENEIDPTNNSEVPKFIEDLAVELPAREIDESLLPIYKKTTVLKVMQRQFSSPERLERLNYSSTSKCKEDVEESCTMFNRKLLKTLSGTERIGLSWPERPLDLLAQRMLELPNSFKSVKSFQGSKSLKASKSFKAYSSLRSCMDDEDRAHSNSTFLEDLDLDSVINRRRKSPYVRIVSKQMVGIFLTIWVRRSLRKHIQNLNVSTVGVGAMGYIGNKGSISVRMSIYQTLFCFICTHLTSGEKDADFAKRNADVHEILRKTHFNSSEVELPTSIYNHERILWLGDLNYRINLSYEETRELISKKDWTKLVEHDQLIKELKRGRVFDGWAEGRLKFAPTYKYEANSDNYIPAEPKAARRNPAWCDRILSFGKEMRLLSYRRTELTFSDHRPITATYMVEVEVFSPRKLQRALIFTDAEIEDEQLVSDFGGMERAN
ncbi:hypothetical protein Leryth_019590 [Lithospermum erythrorhizon]|nr:hypothetical protein Leryth_019590 [Lithospermum erythrorhizon]